MQTPGSETIAARRSLDPSIASIVLKGCPLGHSDEEMTVGELYEDPDLGHVLEDPLNNIAVLEANNMSREQAIGIALGGYALTDENGALVRAASAQVEATTPQPAGEEKKSAQRHLRLIA